MRAVVETSRRLGIQYLSLYAFSTENWNRPPREVDGADALLRRYLASELGKMMKHQIRLRGGRQPPAPAAAPCARRCARPSRRPATTPA